MYLLTAQSIKKLDPYLDLILCEHCENPSFLNSIHDPAETDEWMKK